MDTLTFAELDAQHAVELAPRRLMSIFFVGNLSVNKVHQFAAAQSNNIGGGGAEATNVNVSGNQFLIA